MIKRDKIAYDMAKRIKELNCLYEFSQLVEQNDNSLDCIFQGSTNLIAKSWQYSKITCVRVIFEGREFKTDNFRQTQWVQSADILAGNKKSGVVEVYYLQECPQSDEGPFLKEERKLLNTLAERLGYIVKHRQVEEALRESEEIFSQFMNHSPIYVFFKDENIKAIRLSSNYTEMLGRPLCELLGKNMDALFPPELAKSMIADDKRILKEGKPIEFEEELNGRFYSTIKFPIHREGKPAYLAGFTVDITERKKAEEALQKNLTLYRGLIETTDTGFVIIDQEGNVLDANQEYVRLSGHEYLGQILGRNVVEWTVDYEKEKNAEAVGKCFREGQIRNLEIGYVNAQGKITPIEINATVVKVDGTAQILTLCRDITERKRAEKKLAGYRDRLRAMSSKLLLAEEHQRHQIAAKLHDSIGQDLALSVLKLDTLKKSVSSKDIAAELDKVKKTIEKTIQDTRTLSFDLSSPTLYRFGFVRAIEQWISEQVQGKHGIKATFVENGKIGPLDEDVSIVLFQAAREVLINVIKHAHAKSVKVSIRPIDGKIETIIEDDGVGFETSEIGSFIDKNSGFGLFNIRERLNYLGGDIKIESRPGHGTRITLIAPLQTEENRGRQQI